MVLNNTLKKVKTKIKFSNLMELFPHFKLLNHRLIHSRTKLAMSLSVDECSQILIRHYQTFRAKCVVCCTTDTRSGSRVISLIYINQQDDLQAQLVMKGVLVVDVQTSYGAKRSGAALHVISHICVIQARFMGK